MTAQQRGSSREAPAFRPWEEFTGKIQMKGKIILIITTTTFNIFPEWDVYIGTKDPEFYQTGLKAASVLKLTKISTVRKDLAEGEIGKIDGDLRDEVNQKMKRIFEI